MCPYKGVTLMTAKPSWLVEKEIILDDGSTARWSYDKEGDVLEVFFQDGAASCTVELADGVLLRLDLERGRPLSLAFLAVTPLTRRREFGPLALPLSGLHQLPEPLRQTVVRVITTQPVSSVLKVCSYLPTPRARNAVPVAWLAAA